MGVPRTDKAALTMFPIANRWQVICNCQRGLSWSSIVDHAGCSLATAHEWWANFRRHGFPWNDNAIHNRHANAARFNAQFLRALKSLVRAHPEVFLREMSAIFRRLTLLPEWDQRWPTSTSTLGEMLRLIGYSVKKVERLASERCSAQMIAYCRLARHIPDRCILVADETHFHGAAMPRPRGRALVGQPLEALAPGPRVRQRFSFTAAVSYTRGVLELTVSKVPPSQCGDDWVLFCTSLARRINGFVPGAPWADEPNDCVLLYDNASVHNALADELLIINSVLLMHLRPKCPNFSAAEPVFADYRRAARNLAYHHPDLDDRLIHVLALASVSVGAIQGHYHEARPEMWRYFPDFAARAPLPR